MTTTESSTEQTVSIAGLSLRVVQGGSGASAVWLHHSTGSLGWLPVTRHYGHYGAGASKFLCDRKPNTTGASRDERNLSFEFLHGWCLKVPIHRDLPAHQEIRTECVLRSSGSARVTPIQVRSPGTGLHRSPPCAGLRPPTVQAW